MRILAAVASMVWGACIVVGATAEAPDLSVKVRPGLTVAKPVSPLLVGGVIELAIGRTDNILAEKLYDRGFELPEKFTFNRGWCTFAKEKPELEDWWHSGYEEHRWYLIRSAEDKTSVFNRRGGNWSAPPSGKFYVGIENASKTEPVSLAQDGIWIDAGVGHEFSGLLCDGTLFIAEPVTAKPVDLDILLFPEHRVDGEPLSSARIRVDVHNWWDNPLINDFGTVEFLKFCRHVGAEPMLCVPVMFGDEVNAADWVAFCNKPGHRLHAKSGLTEPIPVKFWELDNETYRRMDAITYARRCVEFSKTMKRVDPAIQIIMNCYWVYHGKLKEMIEIAGPHIDLVNNRGGNIAELRGDLAELDRYNAAHHRSIGLCHSEYRANSYDLPVGKAAEGDTEGLNQPKSDDAKDTTLAKASRWAYGLSVLCDFLDYQSFGGNFMFANFTQSTDGWGENLINIAKTRVYPSAAGQALDFLRRQRMAWPLALGEAALPGRWRVQAAWDLKKKNLIVFIIHMSENQQTLALDISGVDAKFSLAASSEVLFASSPKVFVTETASCYSPLARASGRWRRIGPTAGRRIGFTPLRTRSSVKVIGRLFPAGFNWPAA